MGRVWRQKKRKYRCVTSRKHRKKWWNQMTKRERQQLREAKGETKKLDRVADRYAEIALGIKPKHEIGYSRKSIMKKKAAIEDNDDNHNRKSKVKSFKARKLITKDWERIWCEFCKHPNPKNLMFCQLCDSNLKPFKN
mmetsp:Transcript_73949/g.66565  ORF Transcript_73949/g.66565 Transcript_73949/m.66565 type:complete len:138 (+) Transcript_73949:29-442(+)